MKSAKLVSNFCIKLYAFIVLITICHANSWVRFVEEAFLHTAHRLGFSYFEAEVLVIK